jgi:hypothetical protein
MCVKRAYQNHCVRNLLDEQRIPFDSSLAFKLVFAIPLSILLHPGTAETSILICLQVLDDLIDWEQKRLFGVVLGFDGGNFLAHNRYLEWLMLW